MHRWAFLFLLALCPLVRATADTASGQGGSRWEPRSSRVAPDLRAGVLTARLAAKTEAPAARPRDAAPATLAREFVVMTYNVENLFDVDRVARFEDYEEKPADPNSYGPEKLLRKLEGISRVMKSVGNGAGPDVVLMSELELDFTPESKVPDLDAFLGRHQGVTAREMLSPAKLEEHRGLPSEAWLIKHLSDEGLRGYHVVVGEDFPDPTGRTDIAHKNVVLSRFPIESSKTHPTAGARGIVEAVLNVQGRRIHVFANHWKSGASTPAAEETRIGNARVLRQRLDEILRVNPKAEVIIGGDLNSHYNQRQRFPQWERTAIQEVLGSQGDKAATARTNGPVLYNLWHELPPERRYSDEFNGEWGTLMHLIVTRGLLDGAGVEYVDGSFQPWVVPGLNSQPPLGLPWRWTSVGTGSGTSDHFPLVASFRLQEAPRPRSLAQGPGMSAPTAEALRVGYEKLDRSRLRPATVLAKASRDDWARAMGEIFVVEGTVARGRSAAIDVDGRRYLLHSFDRELRESLRAWKAGEKVRLIGELGLYKGNFQFVIHHASWMNPTP